MHSHKIQSTFESLQERTRTMNLNWKFVQNHDWLN